MTLREIAKKHGLSKAKTKKFFDENDWTFETYTKSDGTTKDKGPKKSLGVEEFQGTKIDLEELHWTYFEEGHSLQEVAEHFGYKSKNLIQELFKKLGWALQSEKKELDTDEIRKLYFDEKWSQRKIAEYFSCKSENPIRRIFKEQEWETRPSNSVKQEIEPEEVQFLYFERKMTQKEIANQHKMTKVADSLFQLLDGPWFVFHGEKGKGLEGHRYLLRAVMEIDGLSYLERLIKNHIQYLILQRYEIDKWVVDSIVELGPEVIPIVEPYLDVKDDFYTVFSYGIFGILSGVEDRDVFFERVLSYLHSIWFDMRDHDRYEILGNSKLESSNRYSEIVMGFIGKLSVFDAEGLSNLSHEQLTHLFDYANAEFVPDLLKHNSGPIRRGTCVYLTNRPMNDAKTIENFRYSLDNTSFSPSDATFIAALKTKNMELLPLILNAYFKSQNLDEDDVFYIDRLLVEWFLSNNVAIDFLKPHLEKFGESECGISVRLLWQLTEHPKGREDILASNLVDTLEARLQEPPDEDVLSSSWLNSTIEYILYEKEEGKSS